MSLQGELNIALITVKALFKDGKGNGVVILNPVTGKLYVSGYIESEDQLYLLLLDDEILARLAKKADDFKPGLRVDIEHDVIKSIH